MTENKNFFNVNDTDTSLQSKSAGKFGLNSGYISTIAFTDIAGKDKTAGNAVDINVLVKDKEYKRRLYETTGSLFGKNNTKIQPGEEGYDDIFYEDMGQKIAVIKHALKAVGVTQQQIDSVITSLDVNDIATGLKKLVALAPTNYNKKPVDIFLEYQWEISDNQQKTFPELPKNMKGGFFLLPEIKPLGKWTETISENGLSYIDDAGNKHHFERNKSFMESRKAIQQGVEKSALTNNPANTPEYAKKSVW